MIQSLQYGGRFKVYPNQPKPLTFIKNNKVRRAEENNMPNSVKSPFWRNRTVDNGTLIIAGHPWFKIEVLAASGGQQAKNTRTLVTG
jgi:hypothetical protein